ncbi:TetR/AcrR family transcriptional regulator [Streptomyces sp. WAC05374]|uniref:TetR/AcrR family transcriptional regulator n=1 Tax=Streptomyces sp. WAC05374 TaxID=2487420 RepID=UPI000F884803|nr:TetR/AcrR family transcriptional regulator [Streptomyces sp. WAC05374]RST19312.1 TetR/AcrR family transcriptional regulator [Streptomyces sp. WAC05374]TDF47694.1 TetR/AcrR family transcriptional regulator [Streptomyces sp. WAC05374]TDF48702.1 TetR/AcrR family transcriptional regulator [Streptomyces sp. WAC05374]TDF59048.1 TetR/AcrR family transcriptional regulator [Streptomyces sp. WAC05374]
MADTRAPDSTRRSERSRRAIYDAALALVGEVGYARTTIEGIAARAGVGKQTIYRWWPSKAAVLLEAFVDLGVQANEALGGDGNSEIPDSGDLEADLKYVLRATVDEMNDPKYDAPTRALTAEGVVDPELGARFVEQLLEPQLELYVRRLDAAREAGQVRPGIDPRVALELFVGPLAHRWLLRTRPLTHAYADSVVEYALYGLAPR